MAHTPTNPSGFVGQSLGPPRILVIEPEPADASAIELAISEHYGRSTTTHVQSLEQALSMDLDQIDLTISVMQTPDASGLEVLEELLLLRPDMPIIMLASDHAYIDAAKVMREGAYDYAVKSAGYLHAIPAIIEKNLALHQVKQENARLQIQLTATLGQLRTRNDQLQGLVKELKQIAATDSLTGIANRRAITQTLDQRFAHALRHNSDIALLAIDLDGFKQLNDAVGHPAGDRVLMQVARVLTANARASDVPGRVGGDEFIIVLPETDTDKAVQVAKRIQKDFALAFRDLAKRVGYPEQITMSVGIATHKHAQTANASDLLAAADRALYSAKDAGRSCIIADHVAL